MKKIMPVILILLISGSAFGVRMRRTILGVGEWYYKILMTLGTCKETLLFSEQQIWGRVRMNRIFDIYYKSGNEHYKVSRVEVNLILNESDVMGYSPEGVGQAKFIGTVFLPLNTFVIFYSLKIFTCDQPAFQNEKDIQDYSSERDDI